MTRGDADRLMRAAAGVLTVQDLMELAQWVSERLEVAE